MKQELLASGFWLLLSDYASIEALRLGLGAGNRPGPGFFPFAAAAAIGIIALSRIFKAHPEQPARNPTGETKKILWIAGGLVSYGLLLESVGFLLCTFVLMALFLKAVASRSWVTALSFAFLEVELLRRAAKIDLRSLPFSGSAQTIAKNIRVSAPTNWGGRESRQSGGPAGMAL